MVGWWRHSGNVDLGPVLTEVFGHEQAVVAAGGRGDGGVEPTCVDGVLHGIAGRGRHGEHDPSLGAVGIGLS